MGGGGCRAREFGNLRQDPEQWLGVDHLRLGLRLGRQLRLLDRRGDGISRLQLVLQGVPPEHPIRITAAEFQQERLKTGDPSAMGPLRQQGRESGRITAGQGGLERLLLGLTAGLGRQGGGGSLSHRGGNKQSGELAIQQRADQQEQPECQSSQNPEATGGTDGPVGSLQHHRGQGEVAGVGSTNGFNREGKGIQGR